MNCTKCNKYASCKDLCNDGTKIQQHLQQQSSTDKNIDLKKPSINDNEKNSQSSSNNDNDSDVKSQKSSSSSDDDNDNDYDSNDDDDDEDAYARGLLLKRMVTDPKSFPDFKEPDPSSLDHPLRGVFEFDDFLFQRKKNRGLVSSQDEYEYTRIRYDKLSIFNNAIDKIQTNMKNELLKLKKLTMDVECYKHCKYLYLYVDLLERENETVFVKTLNELEQMFDKNMFVLVPKDF